MARFCAATLWLAWSTLSAVECARHNIFATHDTALAVQNNQSAVTSIRVGDSLKLVFDGWKIGGSISITGDAGTLLNIALVQSAIGGQKRMVRTATIDGQQSFDQTWGGWPLGTKSRPWTLEITLTDSKWQVWVDGHRTPWFDFTFNQVATGKGWNLVDLITTSDSVQPKTCKIECHAKECLTQCRDDAGNAAACRSKNSETQSTCSAGSDLDLCCDGTKSPVLTVSSIAKGDAVSIVNEITTDSDYLTRACTSANVLGTCGDIKSLQGNGQVSKMRVISKEIGTDNKLTGRVMIWAPKFNTILLFSPWMLVDERVVTNEIIVDGGGDPGMQIEESTSKVVNRGSRFSIPINTYLTRINKAPFTLSRLTQMIATQTQYNISYSDAPQLGMDHNCITDWQWKDSENRGCSQYHSEKWCSLIGHITDAFVFGPCSNNGGRCAFDTFANAAGQNAADRCCGCGGGNFEGWVSDAPTPAQVASTPAPNAGEETKDTLGDNTDIDLGFIIVTQMQLIIGCGSLAGVLVLCCCCCYARGGGKSGADVGNRQLPPPDENAEEDVQGGRWEDGAWDRKDDRKEDRKDALQDDRKGRDRDYCDDSRDHRDDDHSDEEQEEDTRDYRDEERDYREEKSDGRAGGRTSRRDRGDRGDRGDRDRSTSNRQERSLSRARSDASMADDPSSAGAAPSLAPPNQRGRRHQPKPKRRG